MLYNVKEGWGPLCEILRVDVPDEPFPRANDSKVVEELCRHKVTQGLLKWVWVGGVVVVGLGLLLHFLWS